MRDDPDEQEQVRKLRERGSGSSAPVTPPKAKPRKGGRNKVSAIAEPSGTPPRPPAGPRAEARAAGVEFEAAEAASLRGAPPAPAGWRPVRGRPVREQEGDRSMVPRREHPAVVRSGGLAEDVA